MTDASSPGLLMTILSFLLVIGPLIFIHELGHYFAGRIFGVKAEAFSIGFGQEMFGWTDKRGTRWKVGWLPLGGYVRFKGDMNPASQPTREWLSMPPEERAQTFQAKPVWQRFIIVAAGPFTNFLFAIVVFSSFFVMVGEAHTPNVVPSIAPGSAAERAGLRPGDRIVRINGTRIERFEDIPAYVQIRPNQPLNMAVVRGGRPLVLKTVSGAYKFRDRFGNEGMIGQLGVSWPKPVREPVPVYRAPIAAMNYTGEILKAMVVTLKQVVVGQRSVKEMGGPLKIAQYSGQQVSLGWDDFILFMSLISINLGFINLLPIPMLDGGHLFFYIIEGIRRKPLRPKAQEWAFRTGLAALLALMIFVTLNDLASFGLWTKLGGLIG